MQEAVGFSPATAIYPNFLSEREASDLAGVSVATLMRFAEAGYFKTIMLEGRAQFPKQEICEVFGLDIAQKMSASNAESESFQQSADPQIEEKAASSETPSASLAEEIEKFENEKPVRSATDTNFLSEESDTNNTQSARPSGEAFRTVLRLQEELIEQKERRIRELQEERDWLRSRLEKMEDKADRDQMLLMVESQKVRTLLDEASHRQKALPQSGFFKTALDWLGGKPE